MQGHGPFSVVLANGNIFDSSSTEDTFEIKGAVITCLIAGRGKAEDEYHVIKGWQKIAVDKANVSSD